MSSAVSSAVSGQCALVQEDCRYFANLLNNDGIGNMLENLVLPIVECNNERTAIPTIAYYIQHQFGVDCRESED